MAAGSIGRKHEESLVLEQEKKLSGPCDERGGASWFSSGLHYGYATPYLEE